MSGGVSGLVDDPAFQELYDRELVKGARQRSLAIGCVLAVLVAVLVVGNALGVLAEVGRVRILGVSTGLVSSGLPALLLVLELSVWWILRGRSRVPTAFPYVLTLVEMMMPTSALVAFGAVMDPTHAIAAPPLLGYALFIVLAALHMDALVCVFAGVAAAANYAVLFLLFVVPYTGTEVGTFLTDPAPHFMRVLTFLLLGGAAAVVTWQIKQRLLTSMRLREKNDELGAALRELKELQTRLVTSERLAAVGSLVAGIAHEINTPLGVIASSATTASRVVERLAAKDGTSRALEVATESVGLIQTAAARIDGVVSDLRGFVRLDQADMQRVSLNEELDKTLSVARHRLLRTTRIVRDYGELPVLSCHSRQLNQALLALILNAAAAVEATGRPGTVIIRTRAAEDQVLIEVEDEGVGISDELLEQVFEPGFTTRDGAAGLGLAIAKLVATDHGGRIDARSEGPGEGATFRLALPIDVDSQTDHP